MGIPFKILESKNLPAFQGLGYQGVEMNYESKVDETYDKLVETFGRDLESSEFALMVMWPCCGLQVPAIIKPDHAASAPQHCTSWTLQTWNPWDNILVYSIINPKYNNLTHDSEAYGCLEAKEWVEMYVAK